MTVIAWDGKTLAGDKRTNFGGLHGQTTKVHRIGACLVGCAGNAAHIAELLEWVRAGRIPADLPKAQSDPKECVTMLLIEPDGSVAHYESSPYPIRLANRQWAIGSGRDFALAAMHLGKSAAEAVEVANALDCSCGNGVDTLTLEPTE